VSTTQPPPVAAWQALVQSLPEATWVVDAGSLRVVAANPAAHTLLGRTPLVGELAEQLLHTPEDQAYWDEAATRCPGPLASDATVTAADGRTVHVTRCIRPLGATHYTVVLSDRTAQREAEDHHEQGLAELQATLEATADGIFVTDLAGRIRAFNRRFAEIWGIPPDLLAARQDAAVHDWLRRSVVDGAAYQRRLGALLDATLANESDRLLLHSGQVVERVTRPLWHRGRPMGRVFSFRDLSERIAADQRIEELSHTDALTGAPNRARLAQAVHEAMAQASVADGAAGGGVGFALLLMDLDRFRAVNDTLGTATGDQVLREAAQRMRGCLRQGDLLARTGGDQFAMLVHHADVPAAEATARRVLDAVSGPSSVDGAQFTLTCSIGVAMWPAHGQGADELLRHADDAMRSVKDAGRGHYRVHRVHTQRREVDRRSTLKLEHAMRQALAGNAFRLHYQPQVDMRSGQVVGAEALIRWRDPELGDVSPGQFIPVAEESGFIVAIGDWVMNEAVRQAAQWLERGFEVPVAINVSALQFQQPGFVDRVATVLAANGLAPQWLELELTESILVRDAEETLNRLNTLARIGVRLSIDDFGTGYSSLSYLKRFPIDKLKIDRSFVQGLPADESDAGIVRAILQMAQALGMKVIAEGVETEGQRSFLHHAGCAEFQGFLFAPALESHRFEERLAPARALRVAVPQRRIRLVHG
jgi:diguanylate cyclase (GGDEF)-like protein/PAS domain S-box-containing protein